MAKLRNKTRTSTKIGYLVKAVRDGFTYAGAGDNPIGVVTEVVPAGEMCEIQTAGEALVFVGRVVAEGAPLRLAIENEGGLAGVAYPVIDENVYVAIGSSTTKGKGLIRVTLNISSFGTVTSGAALPAGGAASTVLTKVSASDYDVAWSAAAAGYIGWYYRPVSAGDPTQQTLITSGGVFNITGGTDIGTTWTGGNTLTINYNPSTPPGTMDRWYLNVNTGADHSIQNNTQLDFKSGTYATATYGFTAPRHEVIVDVNLTTLDPHYAGLHYLKSEVYTKTEADAAFDNYGSWIYRPVSAASSTQEELMTSGHVFNITGGTDIGTTWTGGNTLTINYTGTPGTMDDWYFRVDSGASSTIANHGIVDFRAGTGISLTKVDSGGIRGVIINSTVTSPWDTVTGGINYAGGNVGIGTASPDAFIHAHGNMNVQYGLKLSSSTVGITAFLGMGYADSTTDYCYIDGDNNGTPVNIALNRNGGNVGIGASLPTELLHIKSGAGSSTDIGLEEDGLGWRIRNDQSNNRLAISSATGTFNTFAERFTILSTGYVGIGTTSPTQKLIVKDVGEVAIELDDNNSYKTRLFNRTSNDQFGIYDVTYNRTFFRHAGHATAASSTLALMEGGGNVGIGDSTPSYKLDVNGTFRTTGQSYHQGHINMNYGAASILLGGGGNNGPHGLHFYDSDNTVGIQQVYRTTPEILYWEDSTEADLMWLDKSGNLSCDGEITAYAT